MKRMEARLQTLPGEAVTIGETTITPFSQALVVRCPFGGFVWNRPVAVVVERAGHTKRIPIFDVTRIVQLGALGLMLVMAVYRVTTLVRRKE